MVNTKIKISEVVENQLPEFVRESFPLAQEFLKEYYNSLEYPGGIYDLVNNLDFYNKIDNLTNKVESTVLSQDVGFSDTSISVDSTEGFPDRYGLLKINNEIITYKRKTNNSFEECIRGFSGIVEYNSSNNDEELVFSSSSIEQHISGDIVENLSILFLVEFLYNIKKQITPGFENRKLFPKLNENIFIKQSKDFYSSKGTEDSYKILFRSLYGKDVDLIRPRDFLIQPSDAQYRITKDIVVEVIEGDPFALKNRTLFQDEVFGINKAFGTVNSVEPITRGDSQYYVISLDFDYDKDISVSGTVFGDFSIHPKTIITNRVLTGERIIDVDSTIGFPDQGELKVDFDDGTSQIITYNSKNLNQFLDCNFISRDISEGSEICLDVYAYAFLDRERQNLIKVRITGVLSDINIPEDNFSYNKGDKIKIISFGNDDNNIISNSFVLNIPLKYEVESFSWLNSVPISQPLPSGLVYEISTIDENVILLGDNVELDFSVRIRNTGQIQRIIKTFTVESLKIPKKSFTIINDLEIINIFYVKRIISKVPKFGYSANVQNTYIDNDATYVASHSLPKYFDDNLGIRDGVVNINGTVDGEIITVRDSNNIIRSHPFFTGESIVYDPGQDTSLNIPKGVYFVYRVNSTQLKLATSRENINNNIFLNLFGNITNNRLVPFRFVNRNLDKINLDSQKLLRKVKYSPVSSQPEPTPSGAVGIFANGVEILNYKSNDFLYYGEIEEVVVTSSGFGYDVKNPPIMQILDETGDGAISKVSVKGSLERVNIIDGGFDYLNEPTISIVGGNGFGAKAKANLTQIDHIVEFNASTLAKQIDLENNIITLSTPHKFRDNDRVLYINNGNDSISGLIDRSQYFVSVQDEFKIKLHNTLDDCKSGINTVGISSFSSGIHRFRAISKKRILKSISVTDGGKNYQSKEIKVLPSDVNIFKNSIFAKNHGYKSQEIVVYTSTQSPIGGLENNKSYYITVIDENQFRLSSVGVGDLQNDFFFRTNQYVDLSGPVEGEHYFNYPPIEVLVSGITGTSPKIGKKYDCIIDPIFRGGIDSVRLISSGSRYGSPDIINFNRKPNFRLMSGSGAKLKPVINDGRIEQILILNPGFGYNSTPNIKIIGDGDNCILVPIINSGSITEVKVINSGNGYSQLNTSVIVESAGREGKFDFKLQSWRINLVRKAQLSNLIGQDESIIDRGLNPRYGLQYFHHYLSRSIRSILFSKEIVDGEILYKPDLDNDLGNPYHSPIIGWAYDGNPIYGPYGYETPEGGRIKRLTSSYSQISSNQNRPNFPLGFFVEDYNYTQNGDLDEHNGRFCKTPEFPNGTYAYFCTIDSQKNPIFPYVIGNTFKSNILEFNYKKESNQDNFNLVENNLLRNTKKYNLRSNNSAYEYISNPNKIINQISEVTSTSTGGIEGFDIISGGNGYRVGDFLQFDNNVDDSPSYCEVSFIEGKELLELNTDYKVIDDIESIKSNFSGKILSFSKIPHNLKNNDFVIISNTNVNLENSDKFYNIRILTNDLILSSDVDSPNITGIITYFEVYGNSSFPNLVENDIFSINGEKIKILNIDQDSSRIRVLRNYEDSVGTSYTSGQILSENSRKFLIDFSSDEFKSVYKLSREIYFNPEESIGVGIGTTVINTMFGIESDEIFVPSKSIYLKNHKFSTGDIVEYRVNDGSGILVSNDIVDFNLQQSQKLYIARITNDFIGISTNRIGLGTEGTFVGIGTTTRLLSFKDFGIGDNHSFKTINDKKLSFSVEKIESEITTKDEHNLGVGDNIILECKSNKKIDIKISYSDETRRILIDELHFEETDINLLENSIKIINHGLNTGDKILYKSDVENLTLSNNSIYFAIKIDKNTIKISDNYFDSTIKNPVEINLSEPIRGRLYKINPEIILYKNTIIEFDISDSSLSYFDGSSLVPAFDFIISKNNSFTEVFLTDRKTETFNFRKIGNYGISGSKIILEITDNIPKELYYTLIPKKTPNLPASKRQIINDDIDIISNNKITIKNSSYNDTHSIIEASSNKFKFLLKKLPESLFYNDNIKYITNSRSSTGPIFSIDIKNKGNYKNIPSILNVISNDGTGFIINPISKSIGKINKTKLLNIGFNYSIDKTIKPLSKLPDIIKVEPLSSIKEVNVLKLGNNYNIAPELIVIDGFTNKIVEDVLLRYDLSTNQVSIVTNTKGLYNVTPRIIPVNNSNGVKISLIEYNSSIKEVTVFLSKEFSEVEDFPFDIGDRIFIENVSVIDGFGYNSKNYNFMPFQITNINRNIGGANSFVKFSLEGLINSNQQPGIFDEINSSGRIIAEKDFPQFEVILEKNVFYEGESVVSGFSIGVVEEWDKNNEFLKVSTSDSFFEGSIIKGLSSGSEGIIGKVTSFTCTYDVSSSSIVKKGWNRETGFLNLDTQRIHNNDYYQYFSYALRSEVPLDQWDEPVSSLNHVSGFKKFSDLVVRSDSTISGIDTNQNEGDFSGISNLDSIIDLDCYNDFDLVYENSIDIENQKISNQIIFNSRELQDYSESIGNRVLVIDDISDQFNHLPRLTPFSIIDTFRLVDSSTRKYFIYIEDERFTQERQILLVTLLQNGIYGFLNQYGRVETITDLGSFEFSIIGDEGNILFYPEKFEFNNYNISFVYYDIKEIVSQNLLQNIGDIILFGSIQNNIIPQIPSKIFEFSTDYRSCKLLVELVNSDTNNIEFSEITLIHDGADVFILNYGQLSDSNFTSLSSSSFGEYSAYILDDKITLEFLSSSSVDISVVYTLIGSSNFTDAGEILVNNGSFNSHYKFIDSSTTPTINNVVSYNSQEYDCSYFIVTVEDLSSQQYQTSEIIIINDDDNSYISEYAVLLTGSEIGTFSTSKNGDDIILEFTPIVTSDIEIRCFQNALKLEDNITS